MTLQERINDLFNRFNVNLTTTEIPTEEVNLEAQASLENGTVVYTDSESFEEGAEVYIINEEGEKIPLPDGDYTFDDGSVMTIADGGKIAKAPAKGKDGEGKDGGEGEGGGTSSAPDGGNSNPSKGGTKKADGGDGGGKGKTPPPAKKKKSAQDKLEETEEEELMEVTEERVLELINRVLDERFPAEEIVEGEKEEEYAEQSAEDALEELKAQLSAQDKEITKLKSQAASEGVKRVVAADQKTAPVDLKNLNQEERITALFNQFNK